MLSKIYKSIAKNYAANLFGMGVQFLNQIAMVPLFISLWGVDKYADWILISALSSLFSMTNQGLNTVTNNEFVIRYQQNDFTTCAKLLTNAFFMVLLVGGVLMLLSAGVTASWGFKSLLHTTVFSEIETSLAFMLLLSNVFIKMYGAIYNGIYYAVRKAYFVSTLWNVLRLAELFILFVGILLKMNIITLLLVYNIPALTGIVFSHCYTRRWFDASLSMKNLDKKTFRDMLKPSVAFMMMPLGFAVSNQGLVFVVNALLGPIVLVAFTTTRTLVNFLKQLMNLLAGAIWPEITAAYGRGDKVSLKNLYYRSLVITFAMTAASIVVLLFVGKPIYLAWTKHAVMFDSLFFDGMLLVLLVSCLWGLSSVIPLATNTHGRFTIAFLISQSAGVVLCFVCLFLFPHIAMIPLVLTLTELALFIFTLNNNNRFIQTNYSEMRCGIWRESRQLVPKLLNIWHKA